MYLVLGRVGDHQSGLTPEERELIAESHPDRIRQFATGRRLAKEGLTHLGISVGPILRNERKPVWPDFVVGSIAHSSHLAASAVAKSNDYSGIGIDVETVNAVDARVAERILDDEERTWIERQGIPEWRTALFSAKEAIYKATNPVTGEFLGFRDVTLEIDENALSFTARTTKASRASVLIERARGYFHRIEGHWLTTFVIESG